MCLFLALEQNLRARLRNKDKLVDQLTTDHNALRSEMAALQRELSESKVLEVYVCKAVFMAFLPGKD